MDHQTSSGTQTPHPVTARTRRRTLFCDDVRPHRPGALLKWLALACTVLALAGSCYLWLWHARGPAGIGCGLSNCGSVLASRWALWFSLPVSALGAAIYLGMAVALSLNLDAPLPTRWAHRLLGTLAVTVAATALWFVLLQAFVLHAFCLYCTFVHANGLIAAMLTLLQLHGPSERLRGPRWPLSAAGGLGLFLVLVIGQLLSPPPQATVHVIDTALPANPSGPEGAITLPGGTMIQTRQWPRMGPTDAPHVLVVFMDYMCGLCRSEHERLSTVVRDFDGQVAVVLMPFPLEMTCNSLMTDKTNNKPDACAMARLALAVWKLAPDSFRSFDDFLMAPPASLLLGSPTYHAQIVSVPAARQYAERLTNAADLRQLLDNSQELNQMIAASIRALGAIPLPDKLLPTIVIGQTVIQGPIKYEQLCAAIESTFGIRRTHVTTTAAPSAEDTEDAADPNDN
ncbi:MAG: thioredoxin domain-containing protein [Phycisphaeraceae bacterium]|nr:thioredoxin domain-containing protein [Phycisphaeraceae bacterium]